jgi:putative copper resistance protein D
LLGLAVIVIALESSLGVYAEVLFSVHMIQHLLLTMVAAPLLVLGAPITLLLRVVSSDTRRRVVLPVLHSLPLRVLAFPVVTWIVFSGYMWVVHFSPLFDAALESPVIHQLEHALFLGTAMLFWWPVMGADPAPWRLPHPARVGYLFIGMPWSSFLGLAIFSATAVLYPHYATLGLDWAPPALADQAVAGGIMWAGGDLLFLASMGIALRAWLRDEDEKGRRNDERLDREAARRAGSVAAGGAAGRGEVTAPEGDAAG